MKPSKKISIYQKVSYLLMLGIGHSALTPVFYKSFSQDAMWFFGTGLSLVFLGLLNIAASKLLNRWLLSMTLLANVIGRFINLPTDSSLILGVEVVLFAVVTSVASGLYPAYRASNMSPVEALRHE